MKVKKDLILDIIYSIIISIILIFENSEYTTDKLIVAEIFKGLILVSIYYLWFQSLSNKFNNSIFVNDKTKSSIIKVGLTIIKQISEMKIGVFIIVYIIYTIYTGDFKTDYIFYKSIQIISTSVYVISIYSLVQSYNGNNNFRWILVTAYFSFYILFILVNVLFKSSNFTLFYFIPSNVFLLFVDYTPLTISLLIYIFGLFFFFFIYFISINKLIKRVRKINLPINRVN